MGDGVETAQRLYGVVEELDAEGEFVGVGENVDDAATHSILSGLHDEVDTFELVFLEHVDDKIHVQFAVLDNLESVFG